EDGVSIQLAGESSDVLFGIAEEVARYLDQIEGMTDVRSDVSSGDREVHVRVDRDRALAYGLSPRQVAQSVAVAMRGQNLREFRGETGEIDVLLEFHGRGERTFADLENLPLFTASGERIPLTAVAQLSVSQGPAQ